MRVICPNCYCSIAEDDVAFGMSGDIVKDVTLLSCHECGTVVDKEYVRTRGESDE